MLTVYHWLPPVLKNLRERHPNVELRIDVDATRNPLTSLLAGNLDLAIMSTPVRTATSCRTTCSRTS